MAKRILMVLFIFSSMSLNAADWSTFFGEKNAVGVFRLGESKAEALAAGDAFVVSSHCKTGRTSEDCVLRFDLMKWIDSYRPVEAYVRDFALRFRDDRVTEISCEFQFDKHEAAAAAFEDARGVLAQVHEAEGEPWKSRVFQYVDFRPTREDNGVGLV